MSKRKNKRTNQPPQRRTLRVGDYLYDVVYIDRKPKYLGLHGAAEADTEYASFCRDRRARQARLMVGCPSNPIPLPLPKAEAGGGDNRQGTHRRIPQLCGVSPEKTELHPPSDCRQGLPRQIVRRQYPHR